MIVWLASYPRSGNTMFRSMLGQVFGCGSYSRYFSPAKFRSRPKSSWAVPLPAPWKKAYRLMSDDPDRVYMVKTHDPPPDTQPAIYIVRNGLAVVRSYKHYLLDVNGRQYSVEQVIRGGALFGSWGEHLDAWNPLDRAGTLLLKYEDLVSAPDNELQRVAEFINKRRKREWVNNFDELHAQNPKMYRQGPAVPADYGFTDEQKQLFFSLHSDWMARLNYAVPSASISPEPRAAFS